MDTEEAIEKFNRASKVFEIDSIFGMNIIDIIKLLQRGEKYEAMWEEFFEMYCGSEVEKNVYVEEVFDELKQKYFPKEQIWKRIHS